MKMEINAVITKIKVLLSSMFCVMTQAASADGAQREMSPRSRWGPLTPCAVAFSLSLPQVGTLVLPDAPGRRLFPGSWHSRRLLRASLRILGTPNLPRNEQEG